MGSVVSTIPSNDRAFRVHVETVLERDPQATPETLVSEIRLAYPHAKVSVGSALGGFATAGSRWYFYRDSRAARAVTDVDWWQDEALPRTVLDGAGRYVDANRAAAELFGVTCDAIVGASSGSFTRHASDEMLARRLFDVLATTGELSSTAVVVRPDGSEVDIEFHTSRVVSGGGYVTVMRLVREAT